MSWKKQSSRTNTGNNTFVNNNYSLSTNLISEESKILGKGLFYNDVDICGNLTVGGTLNVSDMDIEDIIGTLQSNITTLQNTDIAIFSALNTKVDISTLDNYATLDDLEDTDNDLQGSIALKQNLLNTSDFFLVENEPKVGLGTNNPVSAAGSDSFLQIFSQTDCGLSLKNNMSDWDIKNINDGHLTFYKGGSERLTITDTETTLKQGLKVVGSVINIANIPTSEIGLAAGDIWSNGGILTIV